MRCALHSQPSSGLCNMEMNRNAKGPAMASARRFQSRIFLTASLVTLSLFWSDDLRAQGKVPLPDYVIEEFGKPPAVPEGSLSKELQSAVTVAFIDSMAQSSWQNSVQKGVCLRRDDVWPSSRCRYSRKTRTNQWPTPPAPIRYRRIAIEVSFYLI